MTNFVFNQIIALLLSQAGSGKLNIVSAEEKGLTLEDTQGMFLLLAAGFLIAATALLSEWMGGFTRRCRFKKRVDVPSSANSREHLIPTPKTDDGVDDTESRLQFVSRVSTGASRDTLDGQIVNVTHENIVVHNDFDINEFSSRRSSSVDVDREVQEIFERDQNRRRIVSLDVDAAVIDDKRRGTASHGAFGDPVVNK